MTNTLSNSGGAAAALVFESTTFDVVDQNGQQWLKSGQIAQALGYADETAITKLYARRKDEFTGSMSQTVNLTVQGQMRETRIFSLRGAHLLAMFARTAIAALFRKWVLDILDHQTQQPAAPYAPGQTISAAQADILRDLLASFAANMPVDMRGQILREGWGKLESHFKTDYRHIPAAQFTEAISIVSRHAVEWGPRAPSQKALAPVSTTALQLMLVTTCNGQPTVEILPASELPQLILHRDSPFTTAEVLEVAQHANMRITNEVGRLERNSEAARMEKAILALGVGDLAKIAKSAWLELAYRAAGPGAGMAATA